MRNASLTVQALDRDPDRRGHWAALRRVSLESPRFSLAKRMARPMLPHFNVETGTRCGHAGRGGGRRRPVDRSLCRPEYRNRLTIVAGMKVSSLSNAADTEICHYCGKGSATNQQNATAVWGFGGSNYSGVVWCLSRG